MKLKFIRPLGDSAVGNVNRVTVTDQACSSSGGDIAGGEQDMSPQYSDRGTTCFIFPQTHQSVQCMCMPLNSHNQFPINSTAKVAPGMHQNSPFWAQKRNFSGEGAWLRRSSPIANTNRRHWWKDFKWNLLQIFLIWVDIAEKVFSVRGQRSTL